MTFASIAFVIAKIEDEGTTPQSKWMPFEQRRAMNGQQTSMKRWIPVLALLTLPFAVEANGLSDARAQLAPLFTDLGQQNQYWLGATGTVTYGQYQHTLSDFVSVQFGSTTVNGQPATTVMIDARSYYDGALVRRVVGDKDGYVWDHDAIRNTYRVTRYGNSVDSAVPGTSYLNTLGNFVRSRANGPSGFLAHLLSSALQAHESGGGVASAWEPFFASSSVEVDPKAYTITASNAGQDPITTTYTWKTVNGADVLDTVGFSQSKFVNFKQVDYAWTATLHRAEAMPNQDFTFNPGNARLVSVGLRQGF